MRIVKLTITILSFIIVFSLAQKASADTHTWDGSSSIYWNTAGNWDTNSVPVAGDDLVFPLSASNQSMNNDTTANILFNSLTVQDGTYSIAGNNFRLNGLIISKGSLQVSIAGTNMITVNGNITIGTNASNTGTLTIDSGKIIRSNNAAAARTLTINSGSTLTGQGIFEVYAANTANSLTLTLPGTYTISVATFRYAYIGWQDGSTYALTIAPATYGGNLGIYADNALAGDTFNYSLGGHVTVSGNLTLSGLLGTGGMGSISTGIYNLSVGGNFSIGYVPGTENLDIFSFIGGSGTLNIDGNLTIQDDNVGSSTFTAPSSSGAFTLAGNFTNTNGTFTHNSGTLTLDNASTKQTLSGTMTGSSAFNNLTITNASGTDASDGERTDFVPSVDFAAAATANTLNMTTPSTRVEFETGADYTFGNINWNGKASNTKIFLRNSTTSDHWHLNVTGTQTDVSYVNVSRSDASGGQTILASNTTNTNSSNNTNWNFGGAGITNAVINFGRNVVFRNLINFRK